MEQIMDLLRGPVLGVIFMIFLLAGVILITAFAALVAQFGLLLRWRAQPASPLNPASAQPAQPVEPHQTSRKRTSPQVVDEVVDAEVVDAEWWPDEN